MSSFRPWERGFSVTELMLVVAVAATIMVIGLPVMTDVTEGSKLSGAARELERELQSARLKAVTSNRVLRVRLNCPAAGFYRTVEYLNTAADNATNRCVQSAYPYPPSTDLMAGPNYDGPVRTLPAGATVGSEVVQFHPDGTANRVVSGAVTAITTPLTITVTRNNKSKAMTINAAGKIQLQQ